MFTKADWIWYEALAKADSYGEFYDTFQGRKGKITLSVSCDSNYAVYLNGHLAAFGQYADFEHYKVADCVEVTDFCQDGTNHLAVIVWHYKQASSAYSPQKAGLIYELRAEADADAAPAVLAFSSADTLCRQSHAYRTGMEKIITGQMGFSFSYDANKEDDWMSGAGRDFTKSIPVEKSHELIPRPNQKLSLQDRCSSSLIFSGLRNEEYCYLFDLKQEEVGFLELELFSEAAQPLLIAYSEHLYDPTAEKPHILNVTPLLPLAFDTALHVPRLIGGRDFSVEYQAKPGHNLYMNPFRRLGARYLEIRSKTPLQISYAGIRPTMYPLKRTAFMPSGETDRRIYEICVRTLELCLHEHYEDCPWREQCFYAMDSRNQMLCGYVAFEEYEAVRAGLSLFALDRHESGFLSICCPNASDAQLFIPSFSLHYFTAVDEYTRYSGDLSLAREVYAKLTTLLANFVQHKKDGLLHCLPGNAWNFYEWRPQLDGNLGSVIDKTDSGIPKVDLILNALYVLALKHMASIAAAIGKTGAAYLAEAQEMCQKIFRLFYRPESGLFSTFMEQEHYSETANALAILCGAADLAAAESDGGDFLPASGISLAAHIAAQMTQHPERFVPASLSMKCFPYDALLMADRQTYGPWVIDQIRKQYQIMLDAGSTTVWEDEEGAAPSAMQEASATAGVRCRFIITIF
ncbi:MAG: hypothetical protein IKC46_05340 [Lachnospiraceae bacterium]|nr:hypothetical protein [Lachnospiraceae bacterium]